MKNEIIEGYKVCPKCRDKKSILDFNKHKWCRECANKASRSWYYSHKERAKKTHQQWMLVHPNAQKDWHVANKEHHAWLSRNWYLRNHDLNKTKRREHYQNNKAKYLEAVHRRRAKLENAGTFTIEAFLALCEAYDFICLGCKRKTYKLTIDHVIPLSLGGLNIIENIQPLCGSCNRSKGIKIIDYRTINYV